MTVDAYGRDVRTLIRFQADADTDETAGPAVEIPCESNTFGATGDLERIQESPSGRYPSTLVEGLLRGGGEIAMVGDFQWIGWPLKLMFGAPTTTDDTGGDYTHVFEPDETAIPPYATMWKEMFGLTSPLYYRCGGLILNEMRIGGAKSGRPMMPRFSGFVLREQKVVASVASGATARTAPDPIHNYLITTGVAGISGGAAGLTEFSATISNGLELDFETQTGTRFAKKADPAGNFEGSGQLGIRWQTNAQYDAARAGTLLTITQTWQAAADKSLSIVYRNVRLEDRSPGFSGPGFVTASYGWRFAPPPSGQAPMTITLKNQVANYDNPS